MLAFLYADKCGYAQAPRFIISGTDNGHCLQLISHA